MNKHTKDVAKRKMQDTLRIAVSTLPSAAMAIGVDLCDRFSNLCVMDAAGEIA